MKNQTTIWYYTISFIIYMLHEYSENEHLVNPVITVTTPRGTFIAYNTTNIEKWEQKYLLENIDVYGKKKYCCCCVVN